MAALAIPRHRLALAVALCVIAGAGVAQELPLATGQPVNAILTLDQDRLYQSSRFGQQILTEINSQFKALQAENRDIEAGLEEEERKLTEERATLPAEQFREKAAAFDAKVKEIRAARDAKARDLALQRDAAQKKFLDAAFPILASIMAEQGASAIVNRSAIILSFDRIDITDIAIARIDAQLAKEEPVQPEPDVGAVTPPAGGD